MQTMEAAKSQMAGTLSFDVASFLENNIANYQFDTAGATHVCKTTATSKSTITEGLSRTLQSVEDGRKPHFAVSRPAAKKA